MAVDVATVLAQYEQTPVSEPMHGQQGQIRRKPSTDQKRERREQNRKQADLEDLVPENMTVAELLRTSARLDLPLAARQEAQLAAERMTTELMKKASTERELNLANTRVTSVLTPVPVQEMTRDSSDWLTGLPQSTASRTDAEHALIAEASLWFARVSDDVKSDVDEFAEQAKNRARRTASQYGEHAPAAEQAFYAEASRLHAQSVKGGLTVTASTHKTAEIIENVPNLEDLGGPTGEFHHPDAPEAAPAAEPAAAAPHERPYHLQGDPNRRNYDTGNNVIQDKLHEWSHGHDAEGVREMSDAHVQSHFSATAGLNTAMLEEMERTGAASDDKEADEELFGENPDSKKTAASALPQVADDPLPTQTFPNGSDAGYPAVDTSSNRAPALQELEGYTGWDGSSVVPPDDQHAQRLNDDTSGSQDAAANDSISSAGFPVGASYRFTEPNERGIPQQLVITQKESTMTQAHAQCPTCGGQGKVAVRKVAYSGLPQIDQIINADETPGATPYPEQVAFPITGWDGGQAVNQKIQETEQQIAARPQGRPGAPGPGGPGGAVTARQVRANGRDNSGWIGDMGAKGTDYPGYSTPSGYDGSNQLGQPDPVYGFGGDQPNAPKKPFGAQEAADYTNDQGQNWQPGQPTQDDQGWREVASDPMVTSANLEIRRQQQIIQQRAAAIRRQQATG